MVSTSASAVWVSLYSLVRARNDTGEMSAEGDAPPSLSQVVANYRPYFPKCRADLTSDLVRYEAITPRHIFFGQDILVQVLVLLKKSIAVS